MPRFIELRRHTDSDGDVLTDEGVAAALRLGASLAGGYQLGVSTGAQRATQTLACMLAALGQPVPGGVVVEAGLRSEREDDWRRASQQAGSGDLAALRAADPALGPRTRRGWGRRLAGCLRGLGRASGRLWSATARPTRRRCLASPGSWLPRWPRELACW